MLVSDGDEKPHLINCEAICVHEEEAKRIPNVRFTGVNSNLLHNHKNFGRKDSIAYTKKTFYNRNNSITGIE